MSSSSTVKWEVIIIIAAKRTSLEHITVHEFCQWLSWLQVRNGVVTVKRSPRMNVADKWLGVEYGVDDTFVWLTALRTSIYMEQ